MTLSLSEIYWYPQKLAVLLIFLSHHCQMENLCPNIVWGLSIWYGKILKLTFKFSVTLPESLFLQICKPPNYTKYQSLMGTPVLVMPVAHLSHSIQNPDLHFTLNLSSVWKCLNALLSCTQKHTCWRLN